MFIETVLVHFPTLTLELTLPASRQHIFINLVPDMLVLTKPKTSKNKSQNAHIFPFI